VTFVAKTLGQAVAVAGLMPGRYMSDRWITGWWFHRHSGVQASTVAYHDVDGAVLSTHDVDWPVEPTPLTANYVGWFMRRMFDHGARYITVSPVQWHSRECGTIPPVLLIGRRPASVGPTGEPLGDWDGDSRYQLAWEEAHPPR
jgi:hypothetical protein